MLTLQSAPLAARDVPADLFAVADAPLRRAMLAGELAAVDAPQRAEWIRRIDAAVPCAGRDADRRLAVEFWAMLRPRDAADYVERHRGGAAERTALDEALVRGWTRKDPAAAWAWSETRSAENDVDLRRTVLATMAETNPAAGLLRLREDAARVVPSSAAAHEERAFAFFRALAEIGDHEACRRLIDEYPAGETRSQVLFFLGRHLAAHAWDEAADWALSRVRGGDAFFPIAAVALERARGDWRAAFDWIARIENGALRVRVIPVIAGDVIGRAPSLTLAREIEQRLDVPPERDAVRAAFAACGELVRLGPEGILGGAWTIAGARERRIALVRGYGHWFEIDRDAALRHLAQTGNRHPQDRKAVEEFLRGNEKQP